MKPLKSLLLIAAMSAAQAFATIPALYVASDSPGANPDANGGTEDVWTFTGGILFTGDSASNAGGSGAGAGNPAWGFYSANDTAEAFAFHFLNGPLAVGQTLSIDFDNGWVESGGTVGFGLRDSGGGNLFEFLFIGGDSEYRINDSVTGFGTGIGFTGNGFNIAVTLTDALGGYDATINGVDFNGRTLATANDIEQVRVFSANAGGASGSANNNLYANNLQIIPEPSAALLALLGGMGLLRFMRRRNA